MASAKDLGVSSKEFYEFKKQLAALQKFRGRGTELISVYVTPKYPISEITGKLRDEYGQASNIKSAGTRNNVQAALDKIITYLKGFKEPPKNGVAIFCGNISETEGRPDIQLYSLVPPVPLPVQFYRCESQFVLEPLIELVETTSTYGLVVMDGKEATVAILKGKSIKVLKQIHSTAHSKTHKGGQSASRFARLREEGIEFFYERIGEAMASFLEAKNFKGVIVGGPGPAKENFVKSAPFNYQLKILGVVDTGYTDEYGLREVLEKSQEIISEQEAIQEKKLLDAFMREVSREGLSAYGYEAALQAVESNQAKQLLVSEGMELYELKLVCSQCAKVKRIHSSLQAHEEQCDCGGKLRPESHRDLLTNLIGIAEERGIAVAMVSRETAEGQQFYSTFNGIGVFLRYK